MSFPYSPPFILPDEDEDTSASDATDTGGDGDGSLRPFRSHVASALLKILRQYTQSPLLLEFLSAYLRSIQAADDGTISVYKALDPDQATGATLVLLGKLVGERQGDRGLTTFRNAIKTRILMNKSQGRIPDLIAIAVLFCGIADEVGASVHIRELQPARIEVQIDRTPIVPAREIHARLHRSKAAGVALETITQTGALDRAFVLGRAADYPEGNTTNGLSGAYDPTTGGNLAHVLG